VTEALVGYARCTTLGNDKRDQRAVLSAAGVPARRIYLDLGYSGRTKDRPSLEKAIAVVPSGGNLVVPALDRLALSINDLKRIMAELTDKGAILTVGSTLYDPTKAAGRAFLRTLDTFAEFESALISVRTAEGMAAARDAGRLLGPKPKVTPAQQAKLYDDYTSGARTREHLMEKHQLKKSTFYAILNKERQLRGDPKQ